MRHGVSGLFAAAFVLFSGSASSAYTTYMILPSVTPWGSSGAALGVGDSLEIEIYFDSDGWPQEVFDRKVAFTAQVLRQLDADVIGFQELWSEEALAPAMERSGLDATHDLLVPEGHGDDRIICAAAVRRDMLVEAPRWITEFPEACVLRSTGDDPQQPEISVRLSGFSHRTV